MIKRTFLVLAFLISAKLLFAQTIEVPKIALSNVSISLYTENIPDTVKTVQIVFQSKSKAYSFSLDVVNGKIDEEIVINESRNYEVKNSIEPSVTNHIRVIPGWL